MRLSVFLICISFSFTIYGQEYCFNQFEKADTICLSISSYIKVVGEDPSLNKLLASHICKCDAELESFSNLLKALQKAVDLENPNIFIKPTEQLTSNPVAQGGSIGTVIVNMNYLRQLPDPILTDKLGDKEPEILLKEYEKENIPVWASTICAFLGHEIAELTEDIIDKKRHRSYHHCVKANQAEDRIMKETNGVTRKRGKECIAKHKAHTDIITEIENHGYVVVHTANRRSFFDEDGLLQIYSDPIVVTYIEYLDYDEFNQRKYTLDKENCDCNE